MLITRLHGRFSDSYLSSSLEPIDLDIWTHKECFLGN